MSNQAVQIAQLLKETGHAHHQAFLATDGFDPEWPMWYANHMHEKLAPLMPSIITKSELIYLLVLLDKEYQNNKPKTPWPNYYGSILATYNS